MRSGTRRSRQTSPPPITFPALAIAVGREGNLLIHDCVKISAAVSDSQSGRFHKVILELVATKYLKPHARDAAIAVSARYLKASVPSN